MLSADQQQGYRHCPPCPRDRGGFALPRDRGETLVSLLLVITLIGIISVPLAKLLTSTLELNYESTLALQRNAVASSAVSLVVEGPAPDPCDAVALQADISARITVPAGFTLSLSADCSDSLTALYQVTVVDPEGVSLTLPGVRTL